MTISSRSVLEYANPARAFYARCMERIVPLYWIVTTLKIVLVLFALCILNENGPAMTGPFHKFQVGWNYAMRSMVTDSSTTGVLGRSIPSRATLLIFSATS